MNKFTLSCTITISAYTSVMANNADEAVSIASQREPMMLVPNNYQSDDECWMVDVLDGNPCNIRIDE